MKRSITRWTIAAAALAVVTGTASAQALRAEIPLAIKVGGQVLQPGPYRIDFISLTGTKLFHLVNTETRIAVSFVDEGKVDIPKAWRKAGNPVLQFDCGEDTCTLRTMWDGSRDYAYTFPSVRTKDSEPRAALVTIPLTKAD